MPKNATSKLTETAAEVRTLPDSHVAETSPTELYKQHFDEGFFRLGRDETVSNPDGETTYRHSLVDCLESASLPADLADRLKSIEPHVVSFHALQEWDGYVVEVGPDSFLARLTDVTNDGRPDGEEAEIPLVEIDDDSRSRLAPGQLFRWSIGYERSRSRQKTRVSRIIFRRLPTWTPRELERVEEKAKELSQDLTWK